jgi:hypothetical protein
MLLYRCPLEESHGQSTPWISTSVQPLAAPTLYVLVPYLILALAPTLVMERKALLPGLSGLRSWFVISRGFLPLVLHIYIYLYRKTCTRCSVPHQRLLGLPNCPLRLVGQVKEVPDLFRAFRLPEGSRSRVPRGLLFLLPVALLVCALFLWISQFSYFFSPQFQMLPC